MGGHDEKLKKFLQIEKKGDLYELDNSKEKIFKIEIANVIFRSIFNESEFFFDRSRKSNAVFIKIVIFKHFKFAPVETRFRDSESAHLVSKNVPHATSQILRVTEIQQFRSNQLMLKNRYF